MALTTKDVSVFSRPVCKHPTIRTNAWTGVTVCDRCGKELYSGEDEKHESD